MITKYIYDNEDILLELDENDNIKARYTHGPGIDEPIAMIRNNQTYYYHADGLGSIIAITDSSGNVVQRYEYNSFGNITYIQDPNFVQPYTYTGREYDQESGLYYYRTRYYDANVGRFISEDPIGFDGGDVNLYAYVGNNPVNYTDPTGEYAAAIGQVLIRIGPRIGAALAGLAGRIGTIFFMPPDDCKKPCPPCNPPVGTVGYRIDPVPPSSPHYPFPGTHVHLYKMNQNPNNCQCFWQPIGVTEPPPPPGAVPL